MYSFDGWWIRYPKQGENETRSERQPESHAFEIPELAALQQQQLLFDSPGLLGRLRQGRSRENPDRPRDSDPERQHQLETIAANAIEIVVEQCSITERTTARPENLERAAELIKGRLENTLGPENVRLQSYIIDDTQVLEDNFNKWLHLQPAGEAEFDRQNFENKTYYNVVATINDRQEPNQPMLVLGAHYDALGLKNPGADDNSSAIAGVLELARLLKDYSGPYKIELVAYANEEVPCYQTPYMGSYIHAQDLVERQKQGGFGVVVLVLDMIGQYSDNPADQKMSPVFKMLKSLLGLPSVPNYAALIGTNQDHLFARTLQASISKVSRITTVAATLLRNSKFFQKNLDQTDSWSYRQFPNAWPTLYVSDMAPFRKNPKANGEITYHTEHDNEVTLDYQSMAELILGLQHAIEALPTPELLQPNHLKATWQELQPPQLDPVAKRQKQRYLINKINRETAELTDEDLYYLFLTHWDEFATEEAFNGISLRVAQERALMIAGVGDRVERLLLWAFTGSRRSQDKKTNWLVKCLQWPILNPALFPNLLQQLWARSQALPVIVTRLVEGVVGTGSTELDQDSAH